MAHYQGGTARIAVAMLPTVARVLRVSVEELIGAPARRTAGKRGPAPKQQQQLEQIRAPPKAERRAISRVLDSVLAAHQQATSKATIDKARHWRALCL